MLKSNFAIILLILTLTLFQPKFGRLFITQRDHKSNKKVQLLTNTYEIYTYSILKGLQIFY